MFILVFSLQVNSTSVINRNKCNKNLLLNKKDYNNFLEQTLFKNEHSFYINCFIVLDSTLSKYKFKKLSVCETNMYNDVKNKRKQSLKKIEFNNKCEKYFKNFNWDEDYIKEQLLKTDCNKIMLEFKKNNYISE